MRQAAHRLVNGRMRVLGVLALVGTALAVWAVLGGSGEDPDAAVRRDARRAHCLEPGNRATLVRVAVSLKVAAPGSAPASFRTVRQANRPVEVERWSDDPRGGFERVCSALVAMTGRPLLDRPDGPSWWQGILANPVVNVVIGALLTYGFGSLTSRTARRQALADELAKAGDGYVTSANAYLKDRIGPAIDGVDRTELDLRRDELWLVIHRQPFRTESIEELARRLSAAHNQITGAWAGNPDEGLDAAELELKRLQASLTRSVTGDPPVTEVVR